MSILPSATSAVPFSAARRLPLPARQQLALGALAGQSVTALADQHQVSRKFVYRQLGHAHDALDQAFAPPADQPPHLLFRLPVTKPWLRQLVLGLTLICHSSLRGVHELLADLFDYPSSLGSIHNILHQAVADARPHNAQQDLAAIRIGAHDEIFQGGRPVLVGADVVSTYCYLLSPEEHRDADAWGVRLLELCDRGFRPVAAVAETRHMPSLAAGRPERWQREQALWRRWGSRYGVLREAVAELLGQVVRASSVIENPNSRLRNYFFRRRHLGADYRALLQFFRNHRRFVRSEHAERVGKSPAELLTGQSHPHGLELLGYTPFSRN